MKPKLSQKQKHRKKIVLRCINGKLSTRETAAALGLTVRAVQMIIRRYRVMGDVSFIHGNTGRKRINPHKDADRQRIIDIFLNTSVNRQNPFEGISYTYFREIINDYYHINASVNWIKKILNSVGYETPVRHRVKKSAVHMYRERKEHTGELIQADGTPFDWFMSGKSYCIQGFVDDATGYPVGLYMTKNECLLGYIEAFRNMAIKFGIPRQLYPDKAGVFFVNKKANDNKKHDNKKHLTQFGVMMENLGVDMFPAHSPQAKGRIERFWQTIQHRLPNLFRLRGITTVEAANAFLRDEFPAIYRKWFPVKPKSEETFFVEADLLEINSILKATFPGHTDRSGVFSLKGYKFFCPKLADKKILIHLNEAEGLWITEVNKTKKYSVKLIETNSSGAMPDVMEDLIKRVFLKSAKPRFREVYIDIDDVVLEKIKPKRTA